MSALREVVFKTTGKLHSASIRYGGVLGNDGASKASESGNQIARLTRTIETEVIPRLMLAHKKKGEACVEDFDPAPSVEEVAEFSRIILQHDLSVATSYVELLRSNGASLESLFLNLLAPTARLMGEPDGRAMDAGYPQFRRGHDWIVAPAASASCAERPLRK